VRRDIILARDIVIYNKNKIFSVKSKWDDDAVFLWQAKQKQEDYTTIVVIRNKNPLTEKFYCLDISDPQSSKHISRTHLLKDYDFRIVLSELGYSNFEVQEIIKYVDTKVQKLTPYMTW
jgi:hypothetical protein